MTYVKLLDHDFLLYSFSPNFSIKHQRVVRRKISGVLWVYFVVFVIPQHLFDINKNMTKKGKKQGKKRREKPGGGGELDISLSGEVRPGPIFDTLFKTFSPKLYTV